MAHTYRHLRDALGLERNRLLSIFEGYCQDMRSNRRVLEWSCKITGDSFEGARFVHSSRSPDLAEARDAIDRVYLQLYPDGEPGDADRGLFYWLRPFAMQAADRLILAYSEREDTGGKRSEIKVYAISSHVDALRPLLATLVPHGAAPPAGTPRVMIGAGMGDPLGHRSRVYYLWGRKDLEQPACASWLRAWCTAEEIQLVCSCASQMIVLSFKDGNRDMLYLTAPFNQPDLDALVVSRLAKFPIAFDQLDTLRSVGFSKHGEGLAARELNAYFTIE